MWRSRSTPVLLCLSLFAASPAAARDLPRDVTAFLTPWDPASVASFQAHASEIGTIVPAWISVSGPDHDISINPDLAGHAALAATSERPRLLLMVQNATLGQWDGSGAASLLADPSARARFIDALEQQVAIEKADGLMIDLEALPADAQPNLVTFVAEAAARLRAKGQKIEVTAPVADPAWDLTGLTKVADRVVLMAYDQHYPGGPPGPIAAHDWFASTVANDLTRLPKSKVAVAVASYGYDWSAGGPARVVSVDQASALATAAGTTPEVDPSSRSLHFSYTANAVTHDVWMQGADAVADQVRIARSLGVKGIALWRLGTEDPDVWNDAIRQK